jgi:hypothetical protein
MQKIFFALIPFRLQYVLSVSVTLLTCAPNHIYTAQCDPNSAWALLTQDGEVGPASFFLATIRLANLTDYFRNAAQNKALFIPTNQALQQAVADLDFVLESGTMTSRAGRLQDHRKKFCN